QVRSAERKARRGKGLQASWPSAGHNLERVILRDDHDFVAVDFIGGDGAEGSIPCLEDDDRDHERGSEGSTHAVDAKACASLRDICLAPVLEAGTIPRATGPRRPEDWLTSPGAFGSSESTRRHGLARSPTPRGLISKTGFGARKGMASGGWCPNVRSRLSR
ncbi:MAG: hypothetical protein FD150_2198, partial [Rhodobacteraceae bacterium]